MRGVLFLATAGAIATADWPQFRGPNSTGISTTTGLPVDFGPDKNVIWKTSLPPGHSSPVVVGDCIWLTAHDEDQPFVFAIKLDGKILWRREVRRPRKQGLHAANSPASPSVATDGSNIVAFFTDFGLISFGANGEERWRLPLGPLQQSIRHGRVAAARQREDRAGLRFRDRVVHPGRRCEGRLRALAQGTARDDARLFDAGRLEESGGAPPGARARHEPLPHAVRHDLPPAFTGDELVVDSEQNVGPADTRTAHVVGRAEPATSGAQEWPAP